MTRPIIVLIAVSLTLALPAVASAAPVDAAAAQERYYSSYGTAADADAAAAQERYYSSYGEPASAPAAPPSTAAADSNVWKPLAITGGALVLLLGAAELVTLARLRRVTAT